MLQRVLVLEKNRETAERLQTALKRNGAGLVSLVPTMREACLIVAQQPQDLAFVPLEDSEQLLHSLRALQPDLKMILTTADSQTRMPEDVQQLFQGILHTGSLEKELPALLSSEELAADVVKHSRQRNPASPPRLSRLKEACEEVGLTGGATAAQTAVLSLSGKLLGFCGQGNQSQAAAVTELINQSWQNARLTAQLQYLQLPDYYDPRLIYSRAVSGAVLTLITEPDVPIGDLRRLADRLARRLAGPEQKKAETTQSRLIISHGNGSKAEEQPAPIFAIAWRPLKPLPKVLQRVVQECVVEIAAANGCELHHLSVTPTIIHLVIKCPARKTATWAAYQLKSGIDQEIQSRFGIHTTIWRKGFYATESEQPLNESELNMLLAP